MPALVETRDIPTNGYTETFDSDILGIESGRQRLQDVVSRFYEQLRVQI